MKIQGKKPYMLITKIVCCLNKIVYKNNCRYTLLSSRYHQSSKLKRVKSYGDGIYYNDPKETFSNNMYNKKRALPSDSFGNTEHSNCLPCQKQLQDEYNRRERFQPLSSNFEAEEPSVSMLLWDQNHHKSMCPTYESILNNDGLKQNIGNSINIFCSLIQSIFIYIAKL